MVFQQTQVVGCQDGGFRMTRRTFLPWYKKERNARVWVTLLRKNDDQVSLSSLLFSHGVLPYIRKDLAWIFSEQHSGFSVNHNLPLVYFCAVCSHQSKEEEEESFLAKWQYPRPRVVGEILQQQEYRQLLPSTTSSPNVLVADLLLKLYSTYAIADFLFIHLTLLKIMCAISRKSYRTSSVLENSMLNNLSVFRNTLFCLRIC